MLAMFLSLLLQAAQPPRDTPAPGQAKGVISGIVTAADTGVPLRRAQVSLVGGPPPAPGAPSGSMTSRTVVTDGDGRFTFDGLGAGAYRIRVMPGAFRGQYVTGWYGGSTATNGRPVELKDGERRTDANVALRRGGAITGRVVDEFGEPIARVQVYPARVIGGGASFARTGPAAQTDDLGRFRLWGLEAGEYIIAAESRGMGGPPGEGDTEGFAPTFFPAALTEREGSRVRVVGGQEVGELQIQLVRTRTFRITGTVMDSRGNPVPRPNLMLRRANAWNEMMFVGTSMSFDQNGRFTLGDIVPGDYHLLVRPGVPPPPPGAPPRGAEKPEYANVLLSVAADIEDLVVVTRPGVSIAGELVFEDGPPPVTLPGVRVIATPAERMMMMGPQPVATLGSNLQFTLDDMFGPVYIRVTGGLPGGYTVKEVRLGATDITDVPTEFKPEHSKQLRVVVTKRVATLEATVTDDAGAPVEDAMVLVIPEDKSAWRLNSTKMKTIGGARRDGKYTANQVLPGRYFVVAIARDRFTPAPDLGQAFFEPLTADATTVVLNEGETRTVELRLAKSADR